MDIPHELEKVSFNSRSEQQSQAFTAGTEVEEIPEDIPEEESDFEFSDEESSIQIASRIESEPPKCNKTFLLAYEENLSYKDIATTLNLSKNTIKTQMGIAYKILREKLEKK